MFSMREMESRSTVQVSTSSVSHSHPLEPFPFLQFAFQSPCVICAYDVKPWGTVGLEACRETLQRKVDALLRWLIYGPIRSNYSNAHTYQSTGSSLLRLVILPEIHSSKLYGDDTLGLWLWKLWRQANMGRPILGSFHRSFGRFSYSDFQEFIDAVQLLLEYGCLSAYLCTLGEMKKLKQVQLYLTRFVNGLQLFRY